MIMAEFEAKLAQEQKKYLGILVTQEGGARDLSHKQLLEKVQDKLSGWKANLLSHAGRLTLVKSVLLSLSVYYMSVAKIPAMMVKAVTAIIRKFLWGKLDKTRYMSLIGWDKVCMKKEDGGLGVRDIRLFNEALLLKLLWQLASGQDKLWIQIFKAKYYPRKGLWANGSGGWYSPLGRAIQQVKVFFNDDLMWRVGDGMSIGAINQPWYDGWVPQLITSNAQRDSRVADLIHGDTGQWDRDKIRALMGEVALIQIENTTPKPEANPLIGDRLIWLSSTRGAYTTREGYENLLNQVQVAPPFTHTQIAAWKEVWANNLIIPRIQFFLWRAIHDGLPTQGKLSTRITTINPKCPRCGLETEYLMHTLFFCQIARDTWRALDLSITVDHLPLSFPAALLKLMQGRKTKQASIIASIAWYLWKAGNEAIFTNKRATSESILAQVRNTDNRQWSQHVKKGGVRVQRPTKVAMPSGTEVFLIDASWEGSNRAGWGLTCYDKEGELLTIQYGATRAMDPLHAEAMAMQKTLQMALDRYEERRTVRITIMSDCQVLINAIYMNNVEDLPSWRAAHTVAECGRLFSQCNTYTAIAKATRQMVQGPHNLANWARRTGRQFQGTIGEVSELNFTIHTKLNPEVF